MMTKLVNRLKFSFSVIVIPVLAFSGCLFFYSFALPVISDRLDCFDYLSGHVPEQAQKIFLTRLIDAAIKQDYEWIATVSTRQALEQLKEVQSKITKNYEVVDGDDLMGIYDKTVKFDNGTQVFLEIRGSWSCIDSAVTEQKVFQIIKLVYVEERK